MTLAQEQLLLYQAYRFSAVSLLRSYFRSLYLNVCQEPLENAWKSTFCLCLDSGWFLVLGWLIDQWMDGSLDRSPSAAQRARPFIPFCPLESRSFGSMFVTIYATLLVLYADLYPSLLYGSHSCLLIYPLGPFSSRYLPFLCFDSKCCMSSYDSLLVASCSVHSPTGLCQCG